MKDYEVTPPPNRLADRVQLRTAFSTERGTVTKFVVQLEYWLEGDWREVVRYDHDRDAPSGHDITEEGLHREYLSGREENPAGRSLTADPGERGVRCRRRRFTREHRRIHREVRRMARGERRERPVSDEEFESMPERISSHFDRVRDLLKQETDDSDA